MKQRAFLLYGIGNALRNDDGAGLLLAGAIAESLQALGAATEVRLVQQLTPDLAEEIAERAVDGAAADAVADAGDGAAADAVADAGDGAAADAVDGAIVDAAAGAVDGVVFADVDAGAQTATVRRLASSADLGWRGEPAGSHTCTPEFVMWLAARLYGVERPAWLATGPGLDFGHGETLSRTARQALAAAPQLAQEIWRSMAD